MSQDDGSVIEGPIDPDKMISDCPVCRDNTSCRVRGTAREYVMCMRCETRGPSSFNEDRAIRLWNKMPRFDRDLAKAAAEVASSIQIRDGQQYEITGSHFALAVLELKRMV